MVVERGLTRCPRCVTVADYVFIESETDGMRYEVHCHKCGQRYGERSLPWAPPPRVGDAPPIQWPPDCEQDPPRDWRSELRQRWETSLRRSRASVGLLWWHTRRALERTRNQVRERRDAKKTDQTGG